METLRITEAAPDLSFPLRLCIMLRDAEEEFPSVISWVPRSNGRVFQIKDSEKLEKFILPKYWSRSIKYASFRRQLIAYGFRCLGKRQYSHVLFSRDNPDSCARIERIRSQKNVVSPVPNRFDRSRYRFSGEPYVHKSHSFLGNPVISDDSSCDLEPIDISAPLEGKSLSKDSVGSEDNQDNEWVRLFPFKDSAFKPQADHSFRHLHHANPDLEATIWRSVVETIDEDLEPRSIQDMLANPNIWYFCTPSMTPDQQAVVELLLPLSLTLIFYTFGMSETAHICAILLVCLHSIECAYTDFGGGALYKSAIGPLQHIAGDMLLNHSLNSMFLLFGPSTFGTLSFRVVLFLIVANSISAAMNFKIHFDAFVLKPTREKYSKSTTVFIKVLQHKMGRHIQRMLSWDMLVLVVLMVSSYKGTSLTQALAVFFYNLSPFVADLLYTLEFSKQLRKLRRRDRTLFCDQLDICGLTCIAMEQVGSVKTS